MSFLFNPTSSVLYFAILYTLAIQSPVLAKGHFTNELNPYELDPLHIKHYVAIFENCTNILVIYKNQNVQFTRSLIILRNATAQKTESLEPRFSLQRRINPARHCWALFDLLPGKGVMQDYYYYPYTSNYILKPGFGQKFLILASNFKPNIEQSLPKWRAGLVDFQLFEILVIEICSVVRTLNLKYLNTYHHKGLLVQGNPSLVWYKIECLPRDEVKCFRNVQIIGKAVDQLSKYFVTMILHKEGKDTLSRIRTRYDKGSKERLEIVKLIKVTELASFWSFQDALDYSALNLTHRHLAPIPVDNINKPYPFVMGKVETFSFVTCYNVKSDTFVLSGLTTPFDTGAWLCVLLMFSISVLILTLLPRTLRPDGANVMIGIVLENSVRLDGKLFKERFPPKSKVFGVHVLLGVWILMSGMVLTNWYKTSFTMDMIVPVLYTPPWETWLEIEGMEAFVPLNMFEFSNPDSWPPYFYFYMRMYSKLNESTR